MESFSLALKLWIKTIIEHSSNTLPLNGSLRCDSEYANDYSSEMANVVTLTCH